MQDHAPPIDFATLAREGLDAKIEDAHRAQRAPLILAVKA